MGQQCGCRLSVKLAQSSSNTANVLDHVFDQGSGPCMGVMSEDQAPSLALRGQTGWRLSVNGCILLPWKHDEPPLELTDCCKVASGKSYLGRCPHIQHLCWVR